MATPHPDTKRWSLAPTSVAKPLALAFAAAFAGAALFVPAQQRFTHAQSPVESVGFALASMVTALTAALVLDLGMRPLARMLLDAGRLALDPRRPKARPIPRARLLARYAAWWLVTVGLAALFARDAAHRADPTFHGMVAIGLGLVFGGGLLVMAVATASIAPGNEQPDAQEEPRRFGFGAALALGVCASLFVDAECGQDVGAPASKTEVQR